MGSKSKRLSRYIEDRDKAVRSLDLEKFRKFQEKWSDVLTEWPGDEVAEIAMHKMAVEITSMPEEIKEKARKWLLDRGYMPGIYFYGEEEDDE